MVKRGNYLYVGSIEIMCFNKYCSVLPYITETTFLSVLLFPLSFTYFSVASTKLNKITKLQKNTYNIISVKKKSAFFRLSYILLIYITAVDMLVQYKKINNFTFTTKTQNCLLRYD